MGSNLAGTISEQKAKIWLLEQGFEVFENISHFGPADLIAWNYSDDSVLKIDVKTIRFTIKQSGEKVYPNPWKHFKNRKPHITYLGYCPEDDLFIWL